MESTLQPYQSIYFFIRLDRAVLAIVAVACILLPGCDTFTAPTSSKKASSSEETAPTLSFRHWPEGTPLPSVSEWKDARDSAHPSSKKSASSLPGEASPYGCLISTLDPEATPHPYRYDDLYVHYPDSVVTAAGDSTRTLTIVYGSNDLFAEQPRSEKIVVRVARCRIPGLDQARRPLMERLHQFNETNKPAQPDAEEAAPSVSAFIASIEDSTSTPEKSGELLRKNEEEDCTEAIICVDGNCWQDSKECTSDGSSSNGSSGDSSDGSQGQHSGNDTGEGGGGAPPSVGDSGDGGESADPCDQPRTSLCDTNPSEGPPPEPPTGVSDELYDQLNEKEKERCWDYPSQCYYVGQYADWSLNWARDVEPNGAHNGPQDAIRHAAWSGRITLNYGSQNAKAWTDAHEWDSNRPDETRMDQYNNRIGREIGGSVSSLNDLKSEIQKAYENGRLCTNLSDC